MYNYAVHKNYFIFNRGKTFVYGMLHKYLLELFINTLHIDEKKNIF